MVTPADTSSLPETVPSKSVHHRAASSGSEAIYDAELVRRFNAGEETAFIEIMTRYQGLLFSVAFSVLKNRGDAEEIAQDTFLCAHRGLGGFRGDSSLATWLRRIALNLARNRYWYFYRRCRHSSVSLDSAVGEESHTTLLELVPCDAVGPARDVLIGEFSDLIATCIPRLGSPHQEILAMHLTLKHSYAEIAQHFGIGIGTVKSRLGRARNRLRLLMSEACPEFNAAERCVEWFDPVRPARGLEVMAS